MNPTSEFSVLRSTDSKDIFFVEDFPNAEASISDEDIFHIENIGNFEKQHLLKAIPDIEALFEMISGLNYIFVCSPPAMSLLSTSYLTLQTFMNMFH